MTLVCTAIVENRAQRENLELCLDIIKVKHETTRDAVSVRYTCPKPSKTCEQIISIFENYARHEIKVEE